MKTFTLFLSQRIDGSASGIYSQSSQLKYDYANRDNICGPQNKTTAVLTCPSHHKRLKVLPTCGDHMPVESRTRARIRSGLIYLLGACRPHCPHMRSKCSVEEVIGGKGVVGVRWLRTRGAGIGVASAGTSSLHDR